VGWYLPLRSENCLPWHSFGREARAHAMRPYKGDVLGMGTAGVWAMRVTASGWKPELRENWCRGARRAPHDLSPQQGVVTTPPGIPMPSQGRN